MTLLYLLNTKSAEELCESEKLSERLLIKLPESWKTHINSPKSEKVRKDRLFAYSLLGYAFYENRERFLDINETVNEYTYGFLPELCFTEKGRPFLKDVSFDFSVTHTDGLCCVAIAYSPGNRVGVDAEKLTQVSVKTASEFINKYVQEAKPYVTNLFFDRINKQEVEIVYTAFDKYGIYKTKNDITVKMPRVSDPLSVWTATEAVLKADGGGFYSLPSLDELVKKHTCSCGNFKVGDDVYCVSVAVEQKISPLIV